MAGNERVVNLAVRAKDDFSKVLKNLAAMGESATRKFQIQNKKSLQEYQAQIRLTSKEIAAMSRASGDNSVAIAKLNREKAQLIQSAQKLKASIISVRDAMHASKTASAAQVTSDSAAVPLLKQKAAATDALAKSTDRLTTAEKRRMSGSAGTLPGARERNRGVRGEAQEVEVFGLKPWQLTNLGYQVNDVISGIAMGQNPVQILAQQAGQLAQIWPGVMVTLARSVAVIAPVAAALAPLIAAIIKVKQEGQALREFSSELALSADGYRYSAQGLTEVAIAASKFTANFQDARSIISAFAKDGLAQEVMLPLVEMAAQLANVTGESVPDAAAKLGKAFTGNLETIRELDQELNFLTADQYDHIKSLFEAGKEAEALAASQEVLAGRLKDSVQPATDWEKATTDIARAWDDLTTSLMESGAVSFAIKGLDLLVGSAIGAAELITIAAGKIAGATKTLSAGQKLAALGTRITELRQNIIDAEELVEGSDPNSTFAQTTARSIEEWKDELAALTPEYEALTAEITSAAEAQSDIALEAIEVTGETEEQKKKQSDLNDLVESRIDKMTEETARQGELNRQQAVALALNEASNEAKEKGLKLTIDQIAALAEAAGKQFDMEQANSFGSSFGNFESGIAATAALLQKFEGFRSKAYYDVNAYRVGFGSDTVTRKDGSIEMVKEDTVVSLEDAVRDLSRRITDEFTPIAAKAVGAERFGSFTTGQQAAVTSIAYNYGEIPDRIVDALRTGTNEQIAEAIRTLGGDNNGINRERRNKEASLFEGAAVADASEAALDAETKRLETAKDYNDNLAQRLSDQQFELEQLSKAGREAAVAKALRDEELKAKEAGVELTKEQRDAVIDLAGREYDRQNVETEVNAILERRKLLVESLQQAQESGDKNKVADLMDQIRGTDEELVGAIDSAIAFWEAVGGPEADAAILKLQNLKGGMKDIAEEIEKSVLPSAERLNDGLADVAGDGFSALAEALAKGENAAQAFFSAMIQSLGELVIEIGKAIVKQALLNALTGGGGSGGGLGGTISNWITGLFHTGGVIGDGAQMHRTVNPSIFNGAKRFHNGGVAGLGPNEVPIIALKEEEVLTGNDPRHSRNGGGGGTKIKNVNVFDSADVLEQALATEPGERVMMNFMTRRARMLKGALGV